MQATSGGLGGLGEAHSGPHPPGGPQRPDLAQLLAQASLAYGALWCPRAVSAPAPAPRAGQTRREVTAKTSPLPRASTSTSTPESSGMHGTPTLGALQGFHFISQSVPLTGRSLAAGPGRSRPQGRHLLSVAEPAAQRRQGDPRAPSPARPPAPISRLWSAAPPPFSFGEVRGGERGGLSLCSVFITKCQLQPRGIAPSLRKPGRCPRVRRAWALLVRKPGI